MYQFVQSISKRFFDLFLVKLTYWPWLSLQFYKIFMNTDYFYKIPATPPN